MAGKFVEMVSNEKILNEHKNGMSVRRISLKYDLKLNYVSKILRSSGIKLSGKIDFDEVLQDTGYRSFKELLETEYKRLSIKELSKKIGVSTHCIGVHLRKFRITKKNGGKYVHVSNDDIFKLIEQGLSHSQIAKKLSITRAVVENAKRSMRHEPVKIKNKTRRCQICGKKTVNYFRCPTCWAGIEIEMAPGWEKAY